MKCLRKYEWVKLPRDYPDMGKGLLSVRNLGQKSAKEIKILSPDLMLSDCNCTADLKQWSVKHDIIFAITGLCAHYRL